MALSVWGNRTPSLPISSQVFYPVELTPRKASRSLLERTGYLPHRYVSKAKEKPCENSHRAFFSAH